MQTYKTKIQDNKNKDMKMNKNKIQISFQKPKLFQNKMIIINFNFQLNRTITTNQQEVIKVKSQKHLNYNCLKINKLKFQKMRIVQGENNNQKNRKNNQNKMSIWNKINKTKMKKRKYMTMSKHKRKKKKIQMKQKKKQF